LALIDHPRHRAGMTSAPLNLLGRLRREPRPPRVQQAARIAIRLAREDETTALQRLAWLSERPLRGGRTLVAEVDGELLAALPLAGGPALADPFRPTAELSALLELRARQLAGAADYSSDRKVANDGLWCQPKSTRPDLQ
jgi:hypothetical protein